MIEPSIEKQLLEIIGATSPLTSTLDALCRLAEDVDRRRSVSSILLLDPKGEHIRAAVGPSLPASYMAALDGRPADPKFGPCGAAARFGNQVVCRDIAGDERWADEYRALASVHGLRACCSTPIKSWEGRVLGTFAIYLNEPASPTPEQTNTIEQLTRVASIAIEHAESIDVLRRSEERYALAMEVASDGHIDWNLATGEFYISPRMLKMAGHSPHAAFVDLRDWVRRFPFHPEDRSLWEAATAVHFASREAKFNGDFRIVVNDETRWLAFNFITTRDAAGNVIRWTGSVADISDRSRDIATVLDAIPGLVAILSPVGEVDAVNNELVAYCGQPLEAMRQWGTNGTVFSEDLPHVTAIFGHAMSTGEPYVFEARIRRFDGVYRWNQVRGLPFRDARGQIVRWYVLLSDIDLSKSAEEALRLSEKRYERAMLAAEAGFWDWDVPADEFYISPKLLEMTDFPAGTRFESRADFMARVPFYPDDGAKWERAVRELFASGGTHLAMEMRSIHGAETRWALLSGMCVRDADGKILRWTGSATDVTARKRAEEALRESEQRYERAMLAAEAGFWDWEVATDKYYVSPKLLEMIRFPAGTEFVGRADFTARGLWHPGDLANWERAVKELFASGDTRLSGEMRTINGGETRWYLLSGMCLRDSTGKVQRWTGSATDITEQKRAQEALRLSEERYALAMEASEEGHFDWNVQTDEIFASERLKQVLDLPADAENRTRGDLTAAHIPYHPADRERVEKMTRDVLAGPAQHHEVEYRLLRGEVPELRWIRSRWKIFRDAQGVAKRVIGVVSDITERKRAEDELRESEARFRALTELWSDWYWRQDEQHRFTYSSRGSWPDDSSPSSDIGMTRWEIPGAVPLSISWAEHREQLAARERFRDFEYSRPVGDGTLRYVSTSGTPIFDDKGEFRGYQGVARDITERKRAEAELRESEARFRALTALWSDWYWRQDEHFRFTYSSAGGTWPNGSSRSSAVGLCRWEIPGILPLSTSWAEHREQLAARKAFRDFEYSRPAADGTLRYVSSSGTPIFDDKGEFRGYQGVARDITERKSFEEKLRSRQEMVKLAQKAAGAVAFEWRARAGKNQNRWSPDLEAMYGIPAGSYDGTEETLRKLVHPEDWPNLRAAIKSIQKSGELDAEYRVIHPNGAIRWLQARGQALFDPDGNPARVVGFMIDVTDRHVAQEELQRIERQLRQAQRLEALGTLAGGIAHDFNNLLGAIIGYGEMALHKVRAGSRLRHDIERIMIAGERGNALVERILAFSRSGIGERVAVHVEKVMQETLALLAAKLPRDIVVEQRLRAGRAAVMGDPTQIHQVLMNLLTNAVQAMPSGGRLRVSLERIRLQAPRVVTNGSIAARDYVVIEVSDSGSGIPPEILERIFDPFFTTKEVGVGTGLGLSLVHGIVTGLGGAIDVATIVGKGSAFKVYLPLSGEVAVPSKPGRKRAETKTRRAGRGRVLVIDDEQALVRLVTETLAELGYSPVGFTAGAKALQAFLENPAQFDAVITDESMPGISGAELIRKMRALRPDLPILLVSGYLSAAVIERAKQAGATELLKKPLRARQLQIALTRMLPPKSGPARNERTRSKASGAHR